MRQVRRASSGCHRSRAVPPAPLRTLERPVTTEPQRARDHLVVPERRDVAFERLDEAVARVREVTSGRARTGRSHEDADEIDGTIATDSAIGFDPRPILTEFSRRGAPVVVMGQVAGIMHGSRELTGDLDLLWTGDDMHVETMAAVFTAVRARIADQDGQAVACDAAAFRLPKVLFESQVASGDCCTPKLPWGDLDVQGIMERADVARSPDGVVIRFVSLPDLITMRRAVRRSKDQRRAAELHALLQTGDDRFAIGGSASSASRVGGGGGRGRPRR